MSVLFAVLLTLPVLASLVLFPPAPPKRSFKEKEKTPPEMPLFLSVLLILSPLMLLVVWCQDPIEGTATQPLISIWYLVFSVSHGNVLEKTGRCDRTGVVGEMDCEMTLFISLFIY